MVLVMVYPTLGACYYRQEEKKEIRETLDSCYQTIHKFKQNIRIKNKQTIEKELTILHSKAVDLKKKALPISASLEQRCNELVIIISDLLQSYAKK